MATRGRPFEPGNKLGRGRPRGSRNKTTLVAGELLHSYALALMRKAIALALQGDIRMLCYLLERLLPALKEAPVKIGNLQIATIADLSKANETVVKKGTSGEIGLTQAQQAADLIEGRRKVLETEEIEKRLRALEAKQA